MLRAARRQAGMTLRQLADLSGVAESRLSDYENGRHQPSVAMLQRLLRATGRVLALGRSAGPDAVRNAGVFADLLSFVDALPAQPGGYSRRRRGSGEPPTWSELLERARR
jgi:transcriptional regulator with XRE-family HTH domain